MVSTFLTKWAPLLVWIPASELKYGIGYIRRHFALAPSDQVKFAKFWAYFVRNFTSLDGRLPRYAPSVWNVHSMVGREELTAVLANRTNNSLERYNRFLKQSLPPHPRMDQLVRFLRQEMCSQLERLNAVRSGEDGDVRRHSDPEPWIVPDAYHSFLAHAQRLEVSGESAVPLYFLHEVAEASGAEESKGDA